ncbi:uncharacterized protein LOC144161784 [Haemaphysalis longicornis]
MEDLKVKELIEICEELSLDLGRAKRKHAILEIMRKEKVTAEEVNEARVEIKERREREEAEKKELRQREEAEKKERREREEAESRERREEAERRERREEAERQERREEAERQERREEAERQEREAVRQLELKRLEFRQGSPAPSVASPTAPANGPIIRDQLPPFVIGEDMAKYLVKFEHVCERNDIERSLWAQNLLALLPGEASDVITCLSKEAFESYDEVKEALLRKYRLSPEAFRQRFRFAKKGNESHIDFAFRLKADLIEWLKGEEAYDDRDKVVECIALEQFYRCVEDDVRLWLQDKLQEVKLNKAAELAEEYYTRRKLHYKAVRVEKAHGKDAFRKKPEEGKQLERRSFRKDSPPTKETVGEGIDESRKSNSDAKQRADAARAFESRKQIICYNCKKEGHIAANCKQKVAFATIRETEKNMQLLEPYMQEINVNGKKCRALRDSAATMDVVHPSLVSPNDCTGECAWIRQVAEEQSVCLPIARVVIEGGFGKLNTEAAVSAALPEHFPYLFSNSSEQLLKEQGKSFFTSLACMALTRSQARKLSQELDSSPASETRKDAEQRSSNCEPNENSRGRLVEPPAAEAGSVKPFGGETEPGDTESTLSPFSDQPLREDELQVEALPTGPTEKSGELVASDVDRDRTAVTESKGVPKRDKALAETSDRGPYGSADRVHVTVSGSTISAEHSEPEEASETASNRIAHSARDSEVSRETLDGEASQTKPLEPPETEGVPSGVSSNAGDVVAKPASRTRETSEQRRPSGERTESSGSSLVEPPTAEAEAGCVIPIGRETQVAERCEANSMLSPVRDDLLESKVGHFHPNSKPVERRRSGRKRELRAFCYERKRGCEACVPAAVLALKSAPRAITGVSFSVPSCSASASNERRVAF